jgi:tetratricopeptide (TPR) repeat protein
MEKILSRQKDRGFYFWISIVSVSSCLLCFIRGFDFLGYYASLPLSLILSMACASLAITAGKDFFPDENDPSISSFYILEKLFLKLLILIIIPLTILSLNALRVKNCNFLTGFAFYWMGPVLSAFFSASLGAFLASGIKRINPAGIFFYFIFIGSFIYDLAFIYFEAPVFFYNHFLGFYAGAIYDDAIEILSPYVFFRIFTILFILDFCFFSGKKFSIGAGLAICLIASAHLTGNFFGFQHTSKNIEMVLGNRLSTEHFEIFYDDEIKKDIDEIAAEHEFYFHMLKKKIENSPHGKIRSYIYKNPVQKRELTGASRVNIAKPWLTEMHLNRTEASGSVLEHEMAHIFASTMSQTFLRMPLRFGLIPDMTIVEGTAVAFAFHGDPFSPHETARALIELKLMPALKDMLHPTGFLLKHAGVSYTVAGSFVKFLLEKKGLDAIKILYGEGLLEKSSGLAVTEFEKEWHEFLLLSSDFRIPEKKLLNLKEDLSQKGVLFRVCPNEVAVLKRESRNLELMKKYKEAKEIQKKIVDYRAHDAVELSGFLELCLLSGDFDQGIMEAENAFNNQDLSAADRDLLRFFYGDILWEKGESEKAHQIYLSLIDSSLDDDLLRSAIIKARLHSIKEIEIDLREYLLKKSDPLTRAHLIVRIMLRGQDNACVRYLAGRYFFLRENYKNAYYFLSSIGGIEDFPVQKESSRLVLISLFKTGQFDKALNFISEMPLNSLSHGEKLELDEWKERIKFSMQKDNFSK